MFFERKELDSEIIVKLKEELDNDNIFVTEDLIQRTLSAARETNTSIVRDNAVKRRKKVWIRRFSCAAACIIFALIIKSQGLLLPLNSKKSDMKMSSTSTGYESAQISENKNLTGKSEYSGGEAGDIQKEDNLDNSTLQDIASEGIEEENNSGQANSKELFGSVSGSLEQGKSHDISQDSTSENAEGSLDSYSFDVGTSLTAGKVQKDTIIDNEDIALEAVTFDEFIKEEQTKELDASSVNYIKLHESVEAEKKIITDLEVQLEGPSMKSIELESEINWDYKVFVENINDEVIHYYYISKSGIIMIGEYGPQDERNELCYQVKDIDTLIKLID